MAGMTNKEWLEKAKKDDEDLNGEFSRIANSNYPLNTSLARDLRINFRKVKAIEIIAETLIGIKEELHELNKLNVEVGGTD